MTLSGDEEEFMMWEKGRMISTTVATEAAGALAAIQGGLRKNDE